MSDLLHTIDALTADPTIAALTCGFCGKPLLSGGVSDWWCDQDCQRGWSAQLGDALPGAVPTSASPAEPPRPAAQDRAHLETALTSAWNRAHCTDQRPLGPATGAGTIITVPGQWMILPGSAAEILTPDRVPVRYHFATSDQALEREQILTVTIAATDYVIRVPADHTGPQQWETTQNTHRVINKRLEVRRTVLYRRQHHYPSGLVLTVYDPVTDTASMQTCQTSTMIDSLSLHSLRHMIDAEMIRMETGLAQARTEHYDTQLRRGGAP